MCVRVTVIHNTAQNRTVLIIFPLILHTIIITQMMSTRGERETDAELSSYGDRTSAAAGPRLWNSLQFNYAIRTSPTDCSDDS